MTVDLGHAKQALVGKSQLTKRVQRGFAVTTTVSLDDLWNLAEQTCSSYPRKKKFGFGEFGAMVYYMRGNKQRCIGYGSLKTVGGGPYIASVQWALRLESASSPFRLALALGKSRAARSTKLSRWSSSSMSSSAHQGQGSERQCHLRRTGLTPTAAHGWRSFSSSRLLNRRTECP